jgi:hypothetical protein
MDGSEIAGLVIGCTLLGLVLLIALGGMIYHWRKHKELWRRVFWCFVPFAEASERDIQQQLQHPPSPHHLHSPFNLQTHYHQPQPLQLQPAVPATPIPPHQPWQTARTIIMEPIPPP